jgi:hypothetical protein
MNEPQWRVGTVSPLSGFTWIDYGSGTGSCVGSCFRSEMAKYIVDACNAYEAQGHLPPKIEK